MTCKARYQQKSVHDSCGCLVTAEGVCLSNQVQCTTGGCVNSTQLCDGVLDCLDGSDEFTCCKLKNHVIIVCVCHVMQVQSCVHAYTCTCMY